MVDDLKLAISLLEKYEINRKNFRINLPASCILLSRVYLYMEDWENCIAMATKAIEYGSGLIDLSGVTGSKLTVTYDSQEVEWLFGKAENFQYMNYYGAFGASDELVSLFDKDNDGRYISSFANEMTWVKEDGAWNTYYYVLAKKHNPSDLGKAIRLGEAYINRAEAYFQMNDNGKATADYNYIRKHRIKNNTDVSSVTLKDIWNERRRELCFELPRWFDLRRQGMPSITHKFKLAKGKEAYEFTLKEKDPMYTLPIPEGAFKYNTSLLQNPSRLGAERVGVLSNN